MYDKIEKETLTHKTSVLNWEHKLKFVLMRVTRLFGSITRRYVYSSERPSIRAYIFRSSLLSSLPFVHQKSIEKKTLTFIAFSNVSPSSRRLPISSCVTGKLGGSSVHRLIVSGLQPFRNCAP